MPARTLQRRIRLAAGGLLLVAAGVVLPSTSATAASIVVTTTADDYTTNGNCTLREAINAANTDTAVDACTPGSGADQITVPAGTYPLTIPGTVEDGGLTGDLDIAADVTIAAAGATVDAGGLDRVLEVLNGATVTINGMTIRGGYLPLTDPTIGTTSMGGGIYNDGTLTLENSTVTANTADYGIFGGGALGSGIGNDGMLTLTRTRVVGNAMGFTYPQGNGGGIANRGTLSITESTVSDNRAWEGGGGLFNVGTAAIVTSTFSGNLTGCYECQSQGGGIYNGGTITITATTISSNAVDAGDYSGPVRGGGLFSNGSASLANVTVANNTVTHLCDSHCFSSPIAGGIYGDAPVAIVNTIVSGNSVTENQSPPNGGGSVTTAWDCVGISSSGYNLIQTTAGCGFAPLPTDIVGADPMLGKLQGNGGTTWTRNPQPGSPVIDAGNPAAPGSGGLACATRDQRGMPRSDDGNLDGTQRCDIGSVEAAALDSTAYALRFDGWSGAADSNASGGGYRYATTAGAAATFSEASSVSTTTVGLLTFRGPNMGRATIVIDGTISHTVDLYAAGAPRRATISYTVPTAVQHTVKVTALGTKNAASTGTQVRVDGFKTGDKIVDDTSPSVRYGYWSGGKDGRSLNGSFRVGSTGGTVTFDTIGPVFTLITERGPSFGKAQVTIDGVPRGTVDYYSAGERWLSRQTFSGLGAGTHHVAVRVLGTRNPASTGTSIVFDGVTLR